MKGIDRKLGTGLTIVFTVSIGTLAQAQPASAQFLEIATGALNAITGNKPQPQIIQQPVPLPTTHRNLRVGTNNLNGNNFNFCISGCLPNTATATPQPSQYPVFSPRTIPMAIPQQSNITSTSIYTRTGTLPPGAIPQRSPVPGVISPPPPARPVLTIPPIQLPINF